MYAGKAAGESINLYFVFICITRKRDLEVFANLLFTNQLQIEIQPYTIQI